MRSRMNRKGFGLVRLFLLFLRDGFFRDDTLAAPCVGPCVRRGVDLWRDASAAIAIDTRATHQFVVVRPAELPVVANQDKVVQTLLGGEVPVMLS